MRGFGFAILIWVAGTLSAVAEGVPDLAVLGEPRTHAIMRHALAPGYSDPAAFRIDACETQRNLNDAGRRQAAETGAVFAATKVRIDAVWTSQWCRCRDTAALLTLGEPVDMPALNSFFEDRSTRESQTEALRAALLSLPEDETVMMVTHQVNITALLGRGTTSGEVVTFTMAEDGSVRERGSFVMPTR